MTIRPRRGGYQVIVYAGIDPVTGRQRQIARQVKASAKPSAWRPSCAPRSPTAATAAPAPARSASCWTSTSPGGKRAASGSPPPPSTTTGPSSRPRSSRPSASCDSPSSTRSPWIGSTASCAAGPQRLGSPQHEPGPAGPRRAVGCSGSGCPLRLDQLQAASWPSAVARPDRAELVTNGALEHLDALARSDTRTRPPTATWTRSLVRMGVIHPIPVPSMDQHELRKGAIAQRPALDT
jgi:hypothetical protein